jgi:hypothetical protein
MHNSKPAAQMQHVPAMKRAREEAAARRPAPLHVRGTLGQVRAVESLADAINQLMEQHAREVVRDRPEWLRDRDIMREYFGGCSRQHYWLVTKQPDYPKARQISPRVKVRNRFEIEAWLADRPEVA